MSKPLFVTKGNDEDGKVVTLLLRYAGDQDYFRWGEITQEQRQQLEMAGVFELTDEFVEGP